MNVTAIPHVGIATADLQRAIDFYRTRLGLIPATSTDNTAVFLLHSGHTVQLYAQSSPLYEFHRCPVIGFEVEEHQAAIDELRARNVSLIYECADNGTSMVYFTGPGDTAYSLQGPQSAQVETTSEKQPMPVHISVYYWAGVGAEDLDTCVTFFQQTMGMNLTYRDDENDYVLFRLPSKQDFELFGPASEQFANQHCPVIGLTVQDVRKARRALESLDVEFISDV